MVTEILLNEIILFFIMLRQFCNKIFISTNLALHCAFANVEIQSLTHFLLQCLILSDCHRAPRLLSIAPMMAQDVGQV